jgi:hypothetical protein
MILGALLTMIGYGPDTWVFWLIVVVLGIAIGVGKKE